MLWYFPIFRFGMETRPFPLACRIPFRNRGSKLNFQDWANPAETAKCLAALANFRRPRIALKVVLQKFMSKALTALDRRDYHASGLVIRPLPGG